MRKMASLTYIKSMKRVLEDELRIAKEEGFPDVQYRCEGAIRALDAVMDWRKNSVNPWEEEN